MKKLLAILTSLFFTAFGVLMPFTARALSLDFPPCVTGEGGAEVGRCHLCDLLEMTVNLSKLILSILGAVALLFFIYGGIWLLISTGNPERVKTGTKIIAGSITGVIIVFSAFVIVNFALWAMMGGENVQKPTLFDNVWWEGPGCEFSITQTDCTGKSDGESCGLDAVCFGGECKDYCTLVVEGYGLTGYSCKTVAQCSKYNTATFSTPEQCTSAMSCIPNACPRSGEVCCL